MAPNSMSLTTHGGIAHTTGDVASFAPRTRAVDVAAAPRDAGAAPATSESPPNQRRRGNGNPSPGSYLFPAHQYG